MIRPEKHPLLGREQMPTIAVVVPCYRVRGTVADVVRRIPEIVSAIYCVDDNCPEGSGGLIESAVSDPRVRVIRHDHNQGVGGATISGYVAALAEGAEIIVKIDGDGQMDPCLIPRFVAPLLNGEADYTKGNRFYSIDALAGMPAIRVFGNAVLSFATKISTGYWNLFDPTNGLTAIHSSVLQSMPFEKVSKRYFFESDLLFRLSTIRAVVQDVPMKANYGSETSNLRIGSAIAPFALKHLVNFNKRIFYNYYLRDFSVASIEWILGPCLLVFGMIFGALQWAYSHTSGEAATAGTVMVAALPIILGLQLLLSAINFDVAATPRWPIHRALGYSRRVSGPT
jgi:glycosyltransferase involved in cell wall biosynthesis